MKMATAPKKAKAKIQKSAKKKAAPKKSKATKKGC
jgi:hypothetical protein